MDKTDLLKLAVEAAALGGQQLKKYWGKLSNVRTKGLSSDLVTEADLASEEAILSLLKFKTPQIAICAEETSKDWGEMTWVIDPLDGTTNYAHRYPVFSISIALVVGGRSEVGVVYNPITEELFTGVRGGGAFCNGEPLFVSKVETLERSLLATGFPYDRLTTKDNNYKQFCHLTDLSQGVRRPGSAALDLSYVAAGIFEGYWEKGIKPWDIAAGVLFVEEAKGRVSSYDGSPFDLFSGRVLATNGLIHNDISNEITKNLYKRGLID